MCQGVYYSVGNDDVRIHFPHPKAKVPIKTKTGIVLLPWGRRKTQAGDLPLGGLAHLDSVYAGKWDKWFPVPVKLVVKSFMVRDIEGHTHWHDLTKGKFLQGLVARHQHERRAYVVIIDPDLIDTQYERWPRIITGVESFY